MASLERARRENVPGDYFVDDSCIDCDVCRWVAPATFDREGEMSRVHRQPRTSAEEERALKALVACPTSSIGKRQTASKEAVLSAWPEEITGGVWHLGYHTEES